MPYALRARELAQHAHNEVNVRLESARTRSKSTRDCLPAPSTPWSNTSGFFRNTTGNHSHSLQQSMRQTRSQPRDLPRRNRWTPQPNSSTARHSRSQCLRVRPWCLASTQTPSSCRALCSRRELGHDALSHHLMTVTLALGTLDLMVPVYRTMLTVNQTYTPASPSGARARPRRSVSPPSSPPSSDSRRSRTCSTPRCFVASTCASSSAAARRCGGSSTPSPPCP